MKADLTKATMVELSKLKPYMKNTKQHPEAQVNRIAHSITTYGFDQPIVVDENFEIIKGHGRYYASTKLELEEVPVYQQLGLSEQEKMASRIADNKVAESEWDAEVLWGEMSDLQESDDMDLTDFGFGHQTVKSLFKDKDLTIFGLNKTTREEEYDKYRDDAERREAEDDDDADATSVQIESFMNAFRDDKKYLRHMPMLDYLNMHDKILIGFSGGKDSLVGLIWCLENLDHDKLIPYFGDLGWGIDWPHAVTYIKVIEKMYNVKIICSGEADPYVAGGFDAGLIQYGFPHPVSCWVRNHIKIRNTKAVQMKYKKDGGMSMVVILSVRWAESANRRKTYSDRGILKDGNMHFASPILQWTDTDICKFLWDRGLRLSTPYQHADRMGCILCPHEGRKTAISVRKKFPLLWRQILDWHARGARRTSGDLAMHHMKKLISEVSDLQEYEKKFAGVLSPLALSPKEYEDFLEEKLGGELPCEDYTKIPFDKDMHVFPNDIDEEYYRKADLAPKTGDTCNVFG